jgi:hypothetical protein
LSTLHQYRAPRVSSFKIDFHHQLLSCWWALFKSGYVIDVGTLSNIIMQELDV